MPPTTAMVLLTRKVRRVSVIRSELVRSQSSHKKRNKKIHHLIVRAARQLSITVIRVGA